jgi:hypothetical protein
MPPPVALDFGNRRTNSVKNNDAADKAAADNSYFHSAVPHLDIEGALDGNAGHPEHALDAL